LIRSLSSCLRIRILESIREHFHAPSSGDWQLEESNRNLRTHAELSNHQTIALDAETILDSMPVDGRR
jgi:hypothetical protein